MANRDGGIVHTLGNKWL